MRAAFPRFLAVASLIGLSCGVGSYTSAYAASACPEHYAGGQAPKILNPKRQEGFVELCSPHSMFATGYSKKLRAPLYSAEHITAAHLDRAPTEVRILPARADTRLSSADRAEPADAKASPRAMPGSVSSLFWAPMVPAANQWSKETADDISLISNMLLLVPGQFYTKTYPYIELALREYAKKEGELYVITGPVFEGPPFKSGFLHLDIKQPITFFRDKVAVPTDVYKLVYSPKRNEAAAYLHRNVAGVDDFFEISLESLNKKVGMDLLPGVSKPGLLRLPRPEKPGLIFPFLGF